MYAQVVALRREGVRIEFKFNGSSGGPDMYPRNAVRQGALTYGRHRVGEANPRALVLRKGDAAPGTGTILELFQPTLTAVDNYSMCFRGFELLDSGAVVMQEWRVYFGVQ